MSFRCGPAFVIQARVRSQKYNVCEHRIQFISARNFNGSCCGRIVSMLCWRQDPNTKQSQIGIWCSDTKSAPRGSKSTVSAKANVQFFSLKQTAMNLLVEPSVLRLQGAAKEVIGIGGWCSELHVETNFEIYPYGSSILVCNSICNGSQFG